MREREGCGARQEKELHWSKPLRASEAQSQTHRRAKEASPQSPKLRGQVSDSP